jgi:hypothetical protein
VAKINKNEFRAIATPHGLSVVESNQLGNIFSMILSRV